jgi:hypothetical protein
MMWKFLILCSSPVHFMGGKVRRHHPNFCRYFWEHFLLRLKKSKLK